MVQPVIIIGAPRSGTNMLRDMLVQLKGVETWPCDEINYIWRHGNVRYPSDEFTPAMATPKITTYIQQQFIKMGASTQADALVEKTCANSLRVGFVEKVIPDAKFIFIVRDGLDVVGSALERWHASLDVPYILKKARYVPLTDFPYYASRYLLNHVYRIFSQEKRLAFWGPVLDDMDELLRKYTVTEVCALQWKRCVDKSEQDLAAVSSDKVIRVRYETFVNEPLSEYEKIASFLGKSTPDSVKEYLQQNISSTSVGKGRKALGDVQIQSLHQLVAETLARYGYE